MSRRLWASTAAVLLAATLAAALSPPGAPSAAGVWDAKERGCYCHSKDASPAVGFSVSGLPGRYTPGSTYTIEIVVTFTDVPVTANRSQGGFTIEATAGVFSVPDAMAGLVQVNGLQATHTTNGSKQRGWTVNWTAPAEPNLVIAFDVFVNTVNGNRSETFGSDHWTSKRIRIGVGDEPEVTGPPAPSPPFAFETIGVLIFALAAGGYALYTFRSVRRPAEKDAPDNRQPRLRRKKDEK